MIKRLRKPSFSIPALAAALLFALYLVLGFLVLPAVLKSQIEQRAQELLGQRISIGALRFNPLAFRLDAVELLLAAPDGTAMLGAKRLLVDFELRSAIDGAWTFAETQLEVPVEKRAAAHAVRFILRRQVCLSMQQVAFRTGNK